MVNEEETRKRKAASAKWEKLHIVRSAFFRVSHLSAFAYLARNSAVQKFANANNISGRHSSLSYFNIFVLFFFFESRLYVMAAGLAVVLEKRQSSGGPSVALGIIIHFSSFYYCRSATPSFS